MNRNSIITGVARSLWAGWLAACLVTFWGATPTDFRLWMTLLPTIVLVTIINGRK